MHVCVSLSPPACLYILKSASITLKKNWWKEAYMQESLMSSMRPCSRRCGTEYAARPQCASQRKRASQSSARGRATHLPASPHCSSENAEAQSPCTYLYLTAMLTLWFTPIECPVVSDFSRSCVILGGFWPEVGSVVPSDSFAFPTSPWLREEELTRRR